jgi:excinuclease ABC subunit C
MDVNLSKIKEKIKKFPGKPGVYFFKSKKGEVLYVGKATSLKSRVRSYFDLDILGKRGPKILKLMQEFSSIEFTETDSVLEALLLEANLIKTLDPVYNTQEKDNKSYNYVVFTDEDFPKIYSIRGRTMFSLTPRVPRGMKRFGPFPHGNQLREALKIIRKIFPYTDKKCIPATVQLAKNKNLKAPRPCFNRQIGLCPGVCTGEISKEQYSKTVKNLTLFFEGKKKEVIKNLKKEMQALAKERKFEEANKIKNTIFSLEHIQGIALLKNTSELSESSGGEIVSLGDFRVEAYDVAHLAGSSVVGVMTVVEDGHEVRDEYRKFKIKNNPGVDDTGALKEILRRRLKHLEWSLPNLIVVDGAKAQINAAESVLREYNFTIPIVSVVKDERHKPREILGDEKHIKNNEKSIILANSEAHRFAIAYHRKKRRNNFLV